VLSQETALMADRDPAKVCDGTGLAQLVLGWNTTVATNTQIRVGSPTGALFAQGGSSGRAITGKWVGNGLLFYLINMADGATIGSFTANVTNAGCP
jgi:hypothetical protein